MYSLIYIKIQSTGTNLKSLVLYQKEDEEFTVLANCLGLLPSFQSSDEFTSASCLDWPVPAFDMISQWCSELASFADRHPDQVKVCSKSTCDTSVADVVLMQKQLLIV